MLGLCKRGIKAVGRVIIRAYFDKECKVSEAIELEGGWVGSAFRPEAMCLWLNRKGMSMSFSPKVQDAIARTRAMGNRHEQDTSLY